MLTHAQSLHSERASGTRTVSVLIPKFVYVYGVYTDLNGFVYGEKKRPVRIKVVPPRRVSGTVSFEDGHLQSPVAVCKHTPSTVRTVTVYK